MLSGSFVSPDIMKCYVCYEPCDNADYVEDLVLCGDHHAHTGCLFKWLRARNTSDLTIARCEYCRLTLQVDQARKIANYQKTVLVYLYKAVDNGNMLVLKDLLPEAPKKWVQTTLLRMIDTVEPDTLVNVKTELISSLSDKELEPMIIESFLNCSPMRFAWLAKDPSSTFSPADLDVNELLVKLVNSTADKRHLYWIYKEVFPSLRFDNQLNIGRYLIKTLARKEWILGPGVENYSTEPCLLYRIRRRHPELRCYIYEKPGPLAFMYECEESNSLLQLNPFVLNEYLHECKRCKKLHIWNLLDIAMKRKGLKFFESLLYSLRRGSEPELSFLKFTNWRDLISGYPNAEEIGDMVYRYTKSKELETPARCNPKKKAWYRYIII